MAVAINAADRSLNFVIRFLHWIVKRPKQRMALRPGDIGSRSINATKLKFRSGCLRRSLERGDQDQVLEF